MLTEGWDANTVTHVLGVRAFGTQLLCEQVVGRALRRTTYAAQMNVAQQALEANNFRRAEEMLNEVRPVAGEPDPRGWEWHFLQRRLHTERLAVNLPGFTPLLSGPSGPYAISGGGWRRSWRT